jgi:hypothetical protein
MVVRIARAGGVEKSNLSFAHILFDFEAKINKKWLPQGYEGFPTK